MIAVAWSDVAADADGDAGGGIIAQGRKVGGGGYHH